MSTSPTTGSPTLLVYSTDPAVRQAVRMAVGRRPSPELGRIEYVEVADAAQVSATVSRGGVDLCVLDGESWPTGGMGISRQLKNELRDPPPCLLLVARRDDAWLATWSQADAVLAYPIDPVALAGTVVRLFRRRLGVWPDAAESGQPPARAAER